MNITSFLPFWYQSRLDTHAARRSYHSVFSGLRLSEARVADDITANLPG